jgi:hypothetical protein
VNAHLKIVNHLREAVAEDGNPLATEYFDNVSDDKVLRTIFFNYRGSETPKGMRLTQIGLTILKTYFQSYEVLTPKEYNMGSLDLLYLDHCAKLPYFIGKDENDDGKKKLVVFEAKFGIMLKLADGMVATLREMTS